MKKARPQPDGTAGRIDSVYGGRPASAPPPRAGWADAARRMHAAGDDRLLAPPQSSTFDEQEWEW